MWVAPMPFPLCVDFLIYCNKRTCNNVPNGVTLPYEWFEMPPQQFELTAFAVASCRRNESWMKGLFLYSIFFFWYGERPVKMLKLALNTQADFMNTHNIHHKECRDPEKRSFWTASPKHVFIVVIGIILDSLFKYVFHTQLI